MSMNLQQLKKILEAALFASTQPLTLDRLAALFAEDKAPSRDELRAALQELGEECEPRGIELKEVGSGFRMQVKKELGPWIARLWEEKPPKYSRATMETLALIAYKQPITRAEIEDVRGVAVSSHIIKSLLEREWIRVVGHRDVPGKPALFGTTRAFLDYFNLKSLDELPPLAEIRSLEDITLPPDIEETLAKVMAEHSGADESDDAASEEIAANDEVDDADEPASAKLPA